MPSRRSHTKSRKGCLQCKRRHVKVGYFHDSPILYPFHQCIGFVGLSIPIASFVLSLEYGLFSTRSLTSYSAMKNSRGAAYAKNENYNANTQPLPTRLIV
ncbi:hypothetical protein RU639_013054 [Aspergillus parasiticus]